MAEPGLKLTIYRHLPDAEAAWRAVAATSRHYVFQSYDWVSLWQRTSAAAEHTRPFIAVACRQDGRPAIVFPLGIRHRFGCRLLVFLGGEVSDYNAPLIDPAVRARLTVDDVNALWRQIVAAAGADVAWLTRMPETFPDGGINPMVAEEHARHTDNAYAAMPLPRSFAAFSAKRSKAYFATTRRRCRRLEEKGTLTLEIAETQAEIDAVVDCMLQQKRQRLAEHGARPMPPQREQFYRALTHSRIEDGRPHVAALRLDGVCLATHVGVLHQGRMYWLMPAYEAGPWERLSPGRILLHKLVDWSIAHGVEAFDLTVGDEDYKRFWADIRLRLFASRYALDRRGAGFLAAWRLRERLRRTSGEGSKALPVPTLVLSAELQGHVPPPLAIPAAPHVEVERRCLRKKVFPSP